MARSYLPPLPHYFVREKLSESIFLDHFTAHYRPIVCPQALSPIQANPIETPTTPPPPFENGCCTGM